jgi:fibronectin-binding autotransporter adhesin
MKSKILPVLHLLTLSFLTTSQIHAAPITWADSTGNSTWTTNNANGGTATSTSWVGGNAPVNSITTDNAIFTSVSNAQPALTVQTRIAGVDFQMAAGGLAMSGGGGSGNLFQVGAGGIDSSLQTSGTNTITNARISISAAGTWNLFSTANTTSTSTFTFNSTVDLANNLIIAGQRDSAAGNVGSINFSRAITGAGTLTVNSTSTNNTVTFSGPNTYTGITTVNAGNVTVQNDQSSANGGWNIQTPNNGSAPVATVNFSTGSTIAVASANKIQLGAAANSGSHPASTLNVAGTVTNSGALQLERAGVLHLNSGAVWTQSGNLTVTARGGASATLNVNAGAQMTSSGSSTVKLINSGTAGGSGSINITGTGLFTTAAGFENTSAVSPTGSGMSRVTLTDGGTLKLSANVADLTTNTRFNLAGTGGVIDNGGFSTTLSGAFSGSVPNTTTGITGTGGLTSTGNGTLTLTGDNTYTGATAVSQGSLIVGNGTSGSLANTSVTVGGNGSSGTPTLGGRGTIAGATTISSAGTGVVGIHAPGVAGANGGVGSQTFSNNLTYQSGSIFEWDINTAADTSDSVSVGGSLTVDSGAIFKIVSSTAFTDVFWDATRNWNVFAGKDFDSFTLNFVANGTPQLAGDFASEGNFTFTNSGTNLTWTAVPEPTSALAGILLGAGLLRRRRN